MQLIGVNGFKRAGKGEVGNAIQDYHEGVVYQVGFADKLKVFAAKALGFDRPPRDLIALMDSFKETATFNITYDEPALGDRFIHSLTGREYLQWVGSDAGRVEFGDTFWIDQVLPRPNQYGNDYSNANDRLLAERYPEVDCVVITDLRFENEAQRVRDLGGVIWEVVRPGITSDGHQSEQVLPRELVTRTIENDGSLDDLRAKVKEILNADA